MQSQRVNQSLGSRTTNDHQSDHWLSTFLWLHSMNDTNSNCDLGQIIRIIGLVWTRLVSQFIHSLIHWWTNAWRIIIVLSYPCHESMWTLSHVQWAWITQSRLTCSSLRDGLHFDSGNFNSQWPLNRDCFVQCECLDQLQSHDYHLTPPRRLTLGPRGAWHSREWLYLKPYSNPKS